MLMLMMTMTMLLVVLLVQEDYLKNVQDTIAWYWHNMMEEEDKKVVSYDEYLYNLALVRGWLKQGCVGVGGWVGVGGYGWGGGGEEGRGMRRAGVCNAAWMSSPSIRLPAPPPCGRGCSSISQQAPHPCATH
jgi:hypothetical protein